MPAYSDNSDGRLGGVLARTSVLRLGSRWAGGVSLLDDQRTDSRYDLGEVVDQFETHENYSTIYWGRSGGLKDGWARRLSAGLTYEDHAFGAVPGAPAAPVCCRPIARSSIHGLAGNGSRTRSTPRVIATRSRRPKTTRSAGARARRLGYAAESLGSDRNAVMLAGTVSKGLALSERQSLSFGVNTRGRLEDGRSPAACSTADARYYFRQSPRRLLFLNLSATAGANLDPTSKSC